MQNPWAIIPLTVVSLTLSLALVSCGSGDDEAPAEAETAQRAPATILGGGVRAEQDRQRAAEPGETAGGQLAPGAAPAVSHAEAVSTYMRRVQAGDLFAAISVCDPQWQSTKDLAQKLENMSAAASETGMDVGTLASFLVQGVEGYAPEFVSEDGDRAVYRFVKEGQQAREFTVIKTEGGWLVQPPPGGLPHT